MNELTDIIWKDYSSSTRRSEGRLKIVPSASPIKRSVSSLLRINRLVPPPAKLPQGLRLNREVYDKSGRLTDLEIVRKKQFDDAEDLFFRQECYQLKVSRQSEAVTRKLELNGIRLKMQRKRHGQLDCFDLSSERSGRRDEPYSVSQKAISDRRLFAELQNKKLQTLKNAMQSECLRATGNIRTNRKEFGEIRLKNSRRNDIRDLPVKLRLFFKPYRQKVRQRTRFLIRKLILKVAKLGLKAGEVTGSDQGVHKKD